MAITDYASYLDMQKNPDTRIGFTKNHNTTVLSRISSLWTTSPFAGATPTTSTALTSASTGAFEQFRRATAGDRRLVYASLGGTVTPGSIGGAYILCDRMNHSGGMSGIVTTAQTTNIPTAALTRDTGGDGVFMALEIYTAIGSTATTVSASYTNQAGTAGRTSPLTDFGGTGFNAGSRFIILPLQQGDTGVRSVESVTVTATTGTAGNFGVTLFKPLITFPCFTQYGRTQEFDPLLGLCANLPTLEDDRCLFFIHLPMTSTSGSFTGVFLFSEDR